MRNSAEGIFISFVLIVFLIFFSPRSRLVTVSVEVEKQQHSRTKGLERVGRRRRQQGEGNKKTRNKNKEKEKPQEKSKNNKDILKRDREGDIMQIISIIKESEYRKGMEWNGTHTLIE